MNLWARGEGGHPAWLAGVEPDRAFIVAPIGCTPARGIRMKLTCLLRLGIDAFATPGPIPDRICSCRACAFLQTACSDLYIANRTLDESPPYRALPDHSLVDRRTGALIREGGSHANG